jgi:hypothetical protein
VSAKHARPAAWGRALLLGVAGAVGLAAVVLLLMGEVLLAILGLAGALQIVGPW